MYSDVALLSADQDFSMRTSACAATENIPDPRQWAVDNQWQMAAIPGFGDKYAYALMNGVDRPGWDASVITDGDILSAVQALVSQAPQTAQAADGSPDAPEGS